MELQHLVINQRGETIADFTETITFCLLLRLHEF